MNQPGDETIAARYSGYEKWKGWHEYFQYTPDQSDYFRGQVGRLAIKEADVLEIGFGAGEFLQWAIDNGARVVGAEINPTMREVASQRGIALLDAPLEHVSHEHADRFDTIVAFDVFEHFTLSDVQQRLAAAEKMLKTGGHLLLRFPNAQSPFGLAAQHGDMTHRSYLSRGVLEQMIAGSSLSLLQFGAPYRAPGRSAVTFIVRLLRYTLRDMVGAILNFIYATNISWEPVVVAVMGKQGSNTR